MARYTCVIIFKVSCIFTFVYRQVFKYFFLLCYQDCTSITSSGVCKIFGSRCCIPLFELDFSAAPFVFLYLHSNLLLSSATLPYALVLYWNGMAAGGDSKPDDEELQSCIPCDGDKSGSRTGGRGRNISPFVVRKANGTLLTNLPSRYWIVWYIFFGCSNLKL